MSCSKVGEDLYLCCGKEKCSNTSTSIWGSNPYTSDCPPCQGGRHSGILSDEGGFFKMVSVGQVDKFVGSEANGITTADYGSYGGVRVESAPSNPFAEGLITMCFGAGENRYCKGEGCSNTGSLWGSNPYTYDSPMCECARHAGIITAAEGGFFKVEALENNPGEYTGTTANNITSTAYGSYRGVKLSSCEGNPFPGCDSVKQSGSFKEGEEVFLCVQCGQRYIEIENDILANACSFHVQHATVSPGKPACCGMPQPCKKGAHRSEHHCDYHYAKIDAMLHDLGATDTVQDWGWVEDTPLEVTEAYSFATQMARIGRVLRWRTRLHEIEEEILMVQVGFYRFENYFVKFYTPKDLEAIGQVGEELIWRTSDSEANYSQGRWIIKDGVVIGARFEAKTETSLLPDACEAYFTISPLQLERKVKTSDGGLTLHQPSKPYVLPEPVRVGPTMSSEQSRPNRSKGFHTHGKLPLLSSLVKMQAGKVNRVTDTEVHESFTGQLALVNTNKNDNLVLRRITCEYRLVTEKEWQPLHRLEIKQGFTLAPYEPLNLPFVLWVNVTNPLAKSMLGRTEFSTFSMTGRYQPVRFRFHFFDIEENESFRVVEMVNKPCIYNRCDKEILMRNFVDDHFSQYRDFFYVLANTYPNSDELLLSLDGQNDTENRKSVWRPYDLNSLVYRAHQTGEYEVLIREIFPGNNDSAPFLSHLQLYALIDKNTNRVYALKAVQYNAYSYHVQYCQMPQYGRTGVDSKTVENCPAEEKVALPVLEDPNFHWEILPQDDDFDDLPVQKRIGGGGEKKYLKLESSTVANLQRLNEGIDAITASMVQFEAIERSINSLGDSLALIVDSLAK